MNDLMTRLKDETADLHQRAERQEFQQRMFRATVRRDEYAAWLGQMSLVHEALERALAEAGRHDARFAPALAEPSKDGCFAADLAALGVERPEPLPATSALVARIAAAASADPIRLLGHHYVLEGSTNGNRILARRLLPALGLDPARGGRYLDPYGERQREVWAKFKSDMNAIGFSADEGDRMVAAAREMFAAIADLSAELSALPSPAPVAS